MKTVSFGFFGSIYGNGMGSSEQLVVSLKKPSEFALILATWGGDWSALMVERGVSL